jgi:hypothetical protein
MKSQPDGPPARIESPIVAIHVPFEPVRTDLRTSVRLVDQHDDVGTGPGAARKAASDGGLCSLGG